MPEPPDSQTALRETPYGQAATRDGRVFVREGNRLGTLAPEELDAGMRSGRYQLATAQDIQESDHKKRVQDFARQEGAMGSVKAFGEGAARSAIDMVTTPLNLVGVETGTAGDILGDIGGAEYAEAQRMRAEASPVFSKLGQMLPEAAAMFGTGGTATALRGAAKAGGSTLLKRAAREVATDAALGGMSGGQMVKEAAYQTQTPLDSDRFVANVGMGALLGGGLGAAGFGASAAFAKVGGKEALERGVFAASDIVGEGLEGVGGAARVAGAAAEVAGAPGAGRLGHFGGRGLEAAGRLVRGKGDDKAVRELAKQQRSDLAAAKFRREQLEYTDKELTRLGKHEEKLKTDLETYRRRYTDDANKVWENGTTKMEAARLANQRAIDTASDRMAKAGGKVETAKLKHDNIVDEQERVFLRKSEELDPLADEVSDLERRIGNLDERGDVVPAAWEEALEEKSELLLRKRAELEELRLSQVNKRNEAYASLEEAQRSQRLVSDEVKRLEREGQRTTARLEKQRQTDFDRTSQRYEREVKQRQQVLDDTNRSRRQLERSREDLESGQVDLAELEGRQAAEMGKAKFKAWQKSPLGRLTRGGGALIERQMRFAGRPQVFGIARGAGGLDLLQAENDMAVATVDAVNHAADPFKSKPWRPVGGVGDYANYPNGQFRYPGESRRQAFFNRTADMSQLYSNPELMMERLAANTEPLAHYSPELSRNVLNTSFKAAEFMQRFGRASMKIPDPLQPHLTEGVVDDASLRSYELVWNGTMFPGTILDELATWNVREETVTALQNVHPAFLQDVRTNVQMRLYEGGWRPTYQQRIQLGVLLGIPEQTALPDVQSRLAGYAQAANVVSQPQPASAPGGGRPTGRPTISQQTRTLSQSATQSIGNQ